MKRLLKNESGVMTFEWILIITILVIGLIAGLASVRDALVVELADTAPAVGSVDQSYSFYGIESRVEQGEGSDTYSALANVEGSYFNDGITTVDIKTLNPEPIVPATGEAGSPEQKNGL